MASIKYNITFFNYWHCGSGLSGGPDSNTTAIRIEKNNNFLPFIPGKTLKGLLREAAELYLPILYKDQQEAVQEFITEVFGPKDGSFNYDKQSSFFSNAELPVHISANISKEDSHLLFDHLVSTAIDRNGQAKDESLRQIEVTVPMTLEAEILDFPLNEYYLEFLEQCLKGIKQMGSYRTRGLGRCQFLLKKNE